MRVTKAVLTLALLIVSIPAFGRPPSDYLLELEGVKGESKISITGDIDCASGRLQFQASGATAAALTRMCQSRTTIPNLVIVKVGASGRATGQQQTLQNVTFTGCPTGDSSRPTEAFSLNFTTCGTARAIKREIRNSGILKPLQGTGTPVEVESLVINGKSATLRLTRGGAAFVAANDPKKPIPVLNLKMADGQEWSFYEVKMEDLLISSATAAGSDRPMESLSINFTKISGPAAGIQVKR
jgi:type VI protein secretion system component Hcp